MDSLTFNILLSKISTDKQSIIRLYDFCYNKIILHIKRLYPYISAEDIAQEFFLQLLSFKKNKYIRSPISWIYVCCENIVKTKYGDIKTKEVCFENFDYSDFISKVNVEEDIFIKDQVEKIFSLITDSETKEILYLYYWEGYNLREIADLISKNVHTVKQKHARAIKKIKTLLKAYPKVKNKTH